MIAVALSGGVDSAAAAILLHEAGEDLCGVMLALGPDNPGASQVARARSLCEHLRIPFHMVEAGEVFAGLQRSFCVDYLSGRTPNPCVLCNRDLKFGLLLDEVGKLGADRVATGHYVRKGRHAGRWYLGRALASSSQEYFMGLVSQEALQRCLFPLSDHTRIEAEEIVRRSGVEIPVHESSQDVCFLQNEDYVSFVERGAGQVCVPGDILDADGKVIGRHRGALHYTVGQRKGLGMGFGRRVYVLAIDPQGNTVTVGDREQWGRQGFVIAEPNFMKLADLDAPLHARVKVRYRQPARPALVTPLSDGGLAVDYPDFFAPGQLAVAYDEGDDILFAGSISAVR